MDSLGSLYLTCFICTNILWGSNIYKSKNFSYMDIILNYFVLLGAILPIIFGAITSKVVDMEASAGRFQVILSTTKSRSKAYGGKLIMLLLSFLFSISLAVFIFAMLFGNQATMAWLIELLLVFIGCLSTYMIHLWVSLMLGGGASIGLGFVETLIALLSITNLGENIWYFTLYLGIEIICNIYCWK